MQQETYAIKGRVIDAVSDSALENGLVVVEGGTIAYTGPAAGYALPAGMRVYDAGAGTILPGLIDCHTHIGGGPRAGDNDNTHFDNILAASRHLGILLDAGFTTLRDMTLYSGALAKAVRGGIVRGPHIIPGGRVLSPTAGHVDDYLRLSPEDATALNLDITGCVADGVDGCLKAVRRQFREGAEFIKICATGGVSSAVDGLDDVQFSDAEIRVMVEEAARHGTYVAAHCSNAAGTWQALQNGVRCIEHGIDLDERCIAFMAENGVPVVTTLFVSNLVATLTDYPAYIIEKGRKANKTHIASMQWAKAAGITIALGTDFSNSKNTPFAANGAELRAITNAGFTSMEAIRVGTINGARALGIADRVGSLQAGKQADIIVTEGNPLEDIEALTHADRIQLVIRNGKIEKHTREEQAPC